jgi:hypothetical protein
MDAMASEVKARVLLVPDRESAHATAKARTRPGSRCARAYILRASRMSMSDANIERGDEAHQDRCAGGLRPCSS